MKTVKDKEYSFRHVKERMLERYDIEIDMEDYEEMNLWHENDDIIEIQGDQIISKIHYKNKDIITNFCKKRGYITTVLPMRD